MAVAAEEHGVAVSAWVMHLVNEALSKMGRGAKGKGGTLADEGQVYVTHAAAKQYADASRRTHDEELSIESAHRELTELLLHARRVGGRDEKTERWRYRSREERIDITARIAREGPLLVVVSVSARSA